MLRDRPLQYTVLANEIQSIESEGMLLSNDWFRRGSPTTEQLHELRTLVTRSSELLRDLGSELDHHIKAIGKTDERTQLEHAYNLVQELTQSRSAVMELIDTNSQEPHPEFCRALAIKEKAASDQAISLQRALNTFH